MCSIDVDSSDRIDSIIIDGEDAIIDEKNNSLANRYSSIDGNVVADEEGHPPASECSRLDKASGGEERTRDLANSIGISRSLRTENSTGSKASS